MLPGSVGILNGTQIRRGQAVLRQRANHVFETGWGGADSIRQKHVAEIEKRFKSDIINFYYREFVRHGRSPVVVGQALLKDDSTISVWKNGGRYGFESIFLGFAATDRPIEYKLPSGRIAIIAAMPDTLGFIKHAILDRKEMPQANKRSSATVLCPNTSDVVCLHYSTATLPLNEHMLDRTMPPTPNSLLAVVQGCNDIPDGKTFARSDITLAYNDWVDSWLLFHLAIPYRWHFK